MWCFLTHLCCFANCCRRICQSSFCTYRYYGLADADEVTFASSIALQAYFEGRPITAQDMEKCIAFWNENISEQTDPVGRKRKVCCEPYYIPCLDGTTFYKCIHHKRNIPYEDASDETKEVG
jgi:hypothetical protein